MKKLNLIFLITLVFHLTYAQRSPNDFVTKWETTSANEAITIPINTAYTYDYAVKWDGQVSTSYTTSATHIFANAGVHTIQIIGDFPAIYFNNTGDKDKIISIEQWGTIQSIYASCNGKSITTSR